MMKIPTCLHTSLYTHLRPVLGLVRAPLVPLLALGLTAPAFGQTASSEDTWYQIEVVVFERLAGQTKGEAEIWPKDITLDYPQEWRKLISQQKAAAIKAELSAQESLAEREALGLAAEAGSTTPAPTALASEADASRLDEDYVPLPPAMKVNDEWELAYVKLPESERNLNESTGAIDSEPEMRVLFHEAWRQPVGSAASTPAIIVRGGNEYGEHTELEGSIGFSVNRYLHARPDLWLTQFIPNYGQESEHWPRLPAVPKRHRMRFGEENPPLQAQPGSLLAPEANPWDLSTDPLEGSYSRLIEQPFLVTEIVTLEQGRRMRSDELHYIDHPRLGLLIYIEEYTPEEKLPEQPEAGF